MTTRASPPSSATTGQRALAAAGGLVLVPMLIALARGAANGLPPTGLAPAWLAVHLAAIVPALALGAFLLARPKGDRRHRRCGRIWAGLMIVAALSSFGLTGLTGRLSPIHLLSILTLIGVPRAVWAARTGRIAAHRRTVQIVYAGMVIAGVFTFLPGRLLGHLLFG